jgi:hypothetical protein
LSQPRGQEFGVCRTILDNPLTQQVKPDNTFSAPHLISSFFI